MDCVANDELIELTGGFGSGGVGVAVDLRGEADVDGRRSPGFGDTGRSNGSGFDTVTIEEDEEEEEESGEAPPPPAATAEVVAGGAGVFIGGGGIIPLL